MNKITDTLTIGMIITAVLLIIIGLRETFKAQKRAPQLATLPPQSPAPEVVPFGPGETLPSEIFSEIVSWQVSDILVACKWSKPARNEVE